MDVIECQLAIGYGDNKIINACIVWNIQLVSAAFDQDFYQQPGGSLVRIHKSMIPDHAMKQGRRLSRH